VVCFSGHAALNGPGLDGDGGAASGQPVDRRADQGRPEPEAAPLRIEDDLGDHQQVAGEGGQ